MRLDWYQSTINDKPLNVVDVLSSLGDEVRRNDRIAKMYRYTNGVEIASKGVVVASAVFGGNGGGVHCWATSDEAQPFSDLLRAQWPDDHLVTRVDSCQDFADPDAFKKVSRVMRGIAKSNGMKYPRVADPLNPEDGVTQYIGSPSSAYRGRLYGKGFEVASRFRDQFGYSLDMKNGTVYIPDLDMDCPLSHWVRLELQARPKGDEARRLAAKASPEEIWTFTGWSHQLLDKAIGLKLERFYMRSRKTTNHERAVRYICKTFGKSLSIMADELGSWDALGKKMEEWVKLEKMIQGK